MANRVTYQGGEMEGITSDAATEATLEKLLKAFTAQGCLLYTSPSPRDRG